MHRTHANSVDSVGVHMRKLLFNTHIPGQYSVVIKISLSLLCCFLSFLIICAVATIACPTWCGLWTEFGKKEMSTSLNSTAFLLHIFSCTWVWSIKILLHCPQKTAFNWHDRELFYYFMFKARSITPHPNTQREDI